MNGHKRGAVLENRKRAQKTFDVEKYRKDFPILTQKVYGKPLIYLDNAATTQKPKAVINVLTQYYSAENANIHRGIHYLSQKATDAYDDARVSIQHFLNASDAREIIFVRGATEGINLVAQSYGRTVVKEGDEVLITAMEHHSNIVPWQILCQERGAKLKVAPINDDGEIIIGEYEKLLNKKTKFVAITHISNALGTINPVRKMIQMAHDRGIAVLVDGAQSAPHIPVDVRELGCDFFVFSGHKLFGPTGIGVVYGKAELLEKMPPYQGGGDMISSVTFEKTTYNKLPFKFEAGTPHIAGVIGLGAAVDYLSKIGLEKIAAYEKELLDDATETLSKIPGLRIIGTAHEKASIVSFVLADIHAHDIGTILDQEGVAIRAGHHCAMPLMDRFQVPATARASFSFYNTKEEIDRLAAAILKVLEVFS
ncbi:MAG: cysteine sulfinate desulfinase [Omnitrophica bacterium RIFCSPHIGHO2_02_FULL_46_11]|nr:MAG: cysteine sulfinate desulfinase [Omnitrophica bacterium RIFCSPHIGHO2_02_FULL_46_11]